MAQNAERRNSASLEGSGLAPPPGLNIPFVPANWADASMLRHSRLSADGGNQTTGSHGASGSGGGGGVLLRAVGSSVNDERRDSGAGHNGDERRGSGQVLSLENSMHDAADQVSGGGRGGGGAEKESSSSSLMEVLRRVGSTSPQQAVSSSSGTPTPHHRHQQQQQPRGTSVTTGGGVQHPPPLSPFASLAPPSNNNNNNNNNKHMIVTTDANAESLSLRSNDSGSNSKSRGEPPLLPATGSRTSELMLNFRGQLQQMVNLLPPPPVQQQQQDFGGRGGRGGGNRGGGQQYQHHHHVASDPQQQLLEQQSRAVTNAVSHMAQQQQQQQQGGGGGGGSWSDINILRGHFLEFALDTDGSKMLQRLINSAPAVDACFYELRPHAVRLSCHASGNYAVQRMIEFGTELHRLSLVRTLAGFALDFAEDVYGCRVLQRLMDCILPRQCPWQWHYILASCTDQHQQAAQAKHQQQKNGNSNSVTPAEKEVDPRAMFFTGATAQEQQQQLHLQLLRDTILLLQELDGSMPRIIKDQNGNHVAQKILEKAPPTTFPTNFVIEVFTTHMLDLGLHIYGCRVAEKIFDICHDGSQIQVAESGDALSRMYETVAHPATLAQLVSHQYGNYVVQHMLAHAPGHLRARVLAELTPRMRELACDKYGSNVVERMFKHAALGAELDALVAAVVRPDPASSSLSSGQQQQQQQQQSNNNNMAPLPKSAAAAAAAAAARNSHDDDVDSLTVSAQTSIASTSIFPADNKTDSIPVIVDLMRDKFANYVVQKIIEVTASQPHHRDMLVPVIQQYSELIRETTYGQHLLFKVEKAYWANMGGVDGGHGSNFITGNMQPQQDGGGGYRGRGGGRGYRGGGRGGGDNMRGGGGRGGYQNRGGYQQQQQQQPPFSGQQCFNQPQQPYYTGQQQQQHQQQQMQMMPSPHQGLAFYNNGNMQQQQPMQPHQHQFHHGMQQQQQQQQQLDGGGMPLPRSQAGGGYEHQHQQQHQQQQPAPRSSGGGGFPHPLAPAALSAPNGNDGYGQQQQQQQQHHHHHHHQMADPQLFAQVHAYTRASIEANGGQVSPETAAYYAAIAATNAMSVSPNSSAVPSPQHPGGDDVSSANNTTTSSSGTRGAGPQGRTRMHDPYARS